jgi:hypothetical protein
MDARMTDFLGLLNLRLRLGPPPVVSVYPKVADMRGVAALEHFSTDSDYSMDSLSEDDASVSDVRAYREGDGMRKIHWKLTARVSALMSKNYEAVARSGVLLLLDLAPVGGPLEERRRVEDKVIESAVSVAYHLLGAGFAVDARFGLGEGGRVAAPGPERFAEVYERLAFLPFDAGADALGQILDGAAAASGGRMNVCVVSAGLGEGDAAALARLAGLGACVALVYVARARGAGASPPSWLPAFRKSSAWLKVVPVPLGGGEGEGGGS